jgi:biopolymer transport protein ExbB
MRSLSKGRLLLYAVLLVAVIGAIAVPDLWAQAAGEGEAAAPRHRSNPFAIVLKNIDFVFVIIMLCSVIGMTLIIQGFIKVRRTVMMPEGSISHIRELISQRQFKELIEFTESDPSFVSRSLNPALKRAPSFSAMKEAMETAIGEQTAEQFRKIEYLNIIGNLGPLLGLLGTVLGMIESFQAMSETKGQADPAVLSGGISQALCHTMLGLLLAIPCLACFGVLRTMVDRLTVQGALQAEELLLMIKPAEAKPAAAAAPRPGMHPAAPAVRKAPMPAPPVVPAQG